MTPIIKACILSGTTNGHAQNNLTSVDWPFLHAKPQKEGEKW